MLTMDRLTACNTAIDDTTCSLSTLRAQAGKPLRDVILEIHAQHWKANNKSTTFLRNLKCFLPAKTSDRGRPHHGEHGGPVKTLFRPCSQAKDYVALSYPWNPSYGESNDKGGYQLPDGIVPVRNIVLDRTIRFIRYKQESRGIIPFWIDQLSIEQSDSPEHEMGMQSMDLVYKRCTFAVGYLWVEIKTQVQVDRLSSLLSGQIIKEKSNEQMPIMEEGIDAQTEDEVLDVLVQITDDQWWSRAWKFQEDYLAGTRMWLLIRHVQGLDKSYARNELGHLSGELVIKLETFRKYATLFCLALCQKTDRRPFVRNTCEKILQRAGKYNILHKYRGEEYNIQRTTTINVLKDISKRRITVPSDVLAITANVCGYDVRILAAKNNNLKMSLSLGILALCISNGEIIRNKPGDMTLYENIFDFLENHAMNIRAPWSDGALTFIKHCRLSISHLSTAGIHTKGILWKLSDPIRPDCLCQNSLSNHRNSSQKYVYRHGLDDYQRSRLFDLVKVLNQRNKRRYARLANDLKVYLENHDRSIRRDNWPPKFVVDVLAACIVNAMDTGKYLQLARPIGGSPEGGRGIPYRAVFVRDRNEMQRLGPIYIFTSWTRTNKQARDTVECKTLARYVSMEVGVDRMAQHGPVSLRSKKWANGLCFFDGEMKFPFTFAWPESLCS